MVLRYFQDFGSVLGQAIGAHVTPQAPHAFGTRRAASQVPCTPCAARQQAYDAQRAAQQAWRHPSVFAPRRGR